jgi:hypothetical protein
MFRGAHRSSSEALSVFAAYASHTHVMTGRSEVSDLTTADHHMRM